MRRGQLGVGVLVAVASSAALVGCGDSDDGGSVEGSLSSPSPEFVNSQECRDAAAAVLADVEAASQAAPPEHDAATRAVALAQAGMDAVESACPAGTQTAVVDAVNRAAEYAARASACQVAAGFMDLDGDGVGSDCPADDPDVVAAVVAVRDAVSYARERLDSRA